jgi:S1-C subfamily serine protease
VRRGIISAVYPAPSRFPDGFTTDIAVQGGNSGSPVFLADSGLVVGMIYAHVVGAENIAMALPANMIATGLESSLDKGAPETTALPTWESLLADEGQSDLGWTVLSPT